MTDVVIIGGIRTPIGSFGGSLKSTPAVELGSLVLKETLKKYGLKPLASSELKSFEPEALKGRSRIELEEKEYEYKDSAIPIQIDEVIMGNVLGAGQGQNVTRQAMIHAGISKETNAYTVNKVCGSGMKAIALGAQAINSGEADVILAGGMENMSLTPYAMNSARWGARMNDTSMVDLMVYDGLWEIFYGYHMGVTAENIVEKYGITRQEQDELGALSHERALRAIEKGLFREEIKSVAIPQKKGEQIIFDTDERPMKTSAEKMAKLKAVFKKDGTVTAGNASGINDGAAALLLMSSSRARELNLKPITKIKAYASGGVDPAYMGLGPIPAVRKVLKKTGLTIDDMGQIELNEAFASQAIACMRELGLSLEKTNLLGSGISLGHPIGCTGARIVLTLVNEMYRNKIDHGLATLCIGGGQGMAIVLEKV